MAMLCREQNSKLIAALLTTWLPAPQTSLEMRARTNGCPMPRRSWIKPKAQIMRTRITPGVRRFVTSIKSSRILGHAPDFVNLHDGVVVQQLMLSWIQNNSQKQHRIR